MRFLFRLTPAALCALPLLAFRCGTEAELPAFSLPPATQTGANTFGFVLEGQVWREYGKSCTWASSTCDSNQVRVQWSPTNLGSYTLRAGYNAGTRTETFLLRLNNLHRTGTYSTSTQSLSVVPTVDARFSRTERHGDGRYEALPRLPFQVTITRLDTVNQIISGTFEGLLPGRVDTARALTFSDGRFDVRYRR